MSGEPFVEDTTYGQGSYGRRCRICLADDYGGQLEHKPGCPALFAEELERRAGVVAAQVAAAHRLRPDVADAVVLAVLRAFGVPVEQLASTPEREQLLAPLREPLFTPPPAKTGPACAGCGAALEQHQLPARGFPALCDDCSRRYGSVH